jgi:hypothetical protein
MFSWSNMMPSAVHTGVLNGCRLKEQKLKGSRLKAACADLSDLTLEPAEAEYASDEFHSEWVIYPVVSGRMEGKVAAYIELIGSCKRPSAC